MGEFIRDGGPCPSCGEPTEHYRPEVFIPWKVVSHMAPLPRGRKRRSLCPASYTAVKEPA